MIQVATFRIEHSFRINKVGLVIAGDIMSGKISHNNIIKFKNEGSEFSLKIKVISFIDNIREQIFKTGLTFYYKTNLDRERFENMKVEEQIAIIEDEVA